jgi:TonB family protein
MPYGTGGAGGDAEGTAGLGSVGLTGSGSGHGYGGGGGAGFGGRASGVAVVRQAVPEIMGSIDKDLIRRIIRAHIAEVRACYEKGLARDPGLTGKLVLSFTVDRAGGVTRSEIAETTLTDAAVGTCVARAALRWRFPSGPGEFTVSYPFIFEPG